jgi:fucose 4-O-acetylase-like acetyltransferase
MCIHNAPARFHFSRGVTTMPLSKPRRAASPGRLDALDALRAVAIVMVVCIHVLGYCLPLPPAQYAVISFVVQTAGVATFYLTDGYLLAFGRAHKEHHHRQFMQKSARRLLVPWIAFTVLYTAARYAFELAGLMDNYAIAGRSPAEVATAAYSSVYAPQLYFLASLFLIRAVCPVTAALMLKMPVYAAGALLAAGVWALNSYGISGLFPFSLLAGFPGQEPVLHAVHGLQFHACGMLLWRLHNRYGLRPLVLTTFPVLGLCLLGLLAGNLHLPRITQYAYLLSLFLFFAATGFHPAPLLWLGRNTMGIYLLHTPIILKAVSMAVNRLVTIPLLSFTLITCGVVLASVTAIPLLRRLPAGHLLLGEYPPAKKQAGPPTPRSRREPQSSRSV